MRYASPFWSSSGTWKMKSEGHWKGSCVSVPLHAQGRQRAGAPAHVTARAHTGQPQDQRGAPLGGCGCVCIQPGAHLMRHVSSTSGVQSRSQ